MLLRIKRGQQWSPIIVLSQGEFMSKCPDFAVDSIGNVHIAYLRQTSYKGFECFYKIVKAEQIAEYIGKGTMGRI
jgi:GTP cyclohydrolase I